MDDLLRTESNMDLIGWVQSQLTTQFSMTNLGLLHYFLGLEVWQHASGIFLSQKKYASHLLEKFGMQDCASLSCPMDPNAKLSIDDESPEHDSTAYRQLIGSLLYMGNSRPDIAYAMSVLSQFSSKPLRPHWQRLNVFCNIFMVLSHMASIIMAESVAFFPWVYANC